MQEPPRIAVNPDGAGISWSPTSSGYRYTVVYATHLIGTVSWSSVPDAEDLAWNRNTFSGLPHLDVPTIFYAVTMMPDTNGQ